MGKQNKNPGKRWQELLGLTAVPYFGQDTIPYEDEEQNEFVFDPDTMSLINPIDIEKGFYNQNAFEAGVYTPLYDEDDVFLGYAYNNSDFEYLNAFLTESNYNIKDGHVTIKDIKEQILADAISTFISNEFTDSENYELTFRYSILGRSYYQNMILYGYDSTIKNGYKIGIDVPATTGLCIETWVDNEMSNRKKYANGFTQAVNKVKIVRHGAKATIYLNDEKLGIINNVERNTFGLAKWGGGSIAVDNIFLKEIDAIPEINISTTVTDGEGPVESASVTITNTDDDTIIITGTTGTAGGCTLSNVPVGTYNVNATATGYIDYTDTIRFTNETTTLNIIMFKESNNVEPPAG